jgi:hypothetical protein
MANRSEPSSRHYDGKLKEILKRSAKIFAEKGFHHTSIRDISRGRETGGVKRGQAAFPKSTIPETLKPFDEKRLLDAMLLAVPR